MRYQRGLGTLPPLFHPLSETDRAKLRESGCLVMLGKGERLFRFGQIVDSVAFVYGGWVALEIRGASVLLLRPGDAHLNALEFVERRADVEARAMSAASVALLDMKTLKAVLPRYPDVLFAIYERATSRIDLLFLAQARQGGDPLEVRLAWLLWTLAHPEPDGARRLTDEVPQSVLAGMLGASREEINRKRRMLVRTGYLAAGTHGARLDPSTALLLGAHDYPV